MPSPLIKSLPHPTRSGLGNAPTRHAHRDLVARRGAGRPEERHHAPLGSSRNAPSAPKDQRTKSAYIYGAICPAEGKAAGLVLPRCNTEGMTLHLAEIAATVAPGAHAVLLLDQAGWNGSEALIVPPNITLMPLPSKCQSSTRSRTSGSSCATTGYQTRIFRSYEDILDHCCFAWNRLVNQPWRIMSIRRRKWAHGS